jgi:hypothetical protein
MSALDGGEWSAQASAGLSQDRAPDTHSTGGLVGPRAGLKLWQRKKYPYPTGNRTPVVDPVA